MPAHDVPKSSPTSLKSVWADPRAQAILACTAYCFFSASMVFVNKILLSVYSFPFNYTLIFVQNSLAVVILIAAKHWGAISVDSFSWNTAILWLPVDILFVAMLVTGTLSLRLLVVPMVTIFKNLTNILIATGDRIWFANEISFGLMGSFALLIVGSIVAGFNDLSFNATGYMWMACNCVCTAAYVLYMRHAVKRTHLSDFGMSYYNNLLSLPLLAVMGITMGEWQQIGSFEYLTSPPFLFCLAFSGTVGFLLSLSSFWCVRTTSATTYGTVGSLNKIPVAILGIIFFKNKVSLYSGLGIGLGLGGGVVYGLVKNQLQRAKQQEKEIELGRRHKLPEGKPKF